MKNVILGSSANALGIVHALRKTKENILILSCEENSISKYSKYVDKYIDICNEHSIILKKLLSLSKYDSIIIYPTNDFWVDFIYKNQEELSRNNILFFENDKETILTFLDKLKFFESFSHQLKIPETRSWTEKKNKQLITKPRYSYFNGELVDKGFSNGANNAAFGKKWIQQKFIKTNLEQHYSVVGLSLHGKIKSFIITHKLLEYPLHGGTATAVSTVADSKLCSQLYTVAEKLISLTNYSGCFEVEIIQEDDKLWVIEINARFWLQHMIGIGFNGTNFPLIYRSLLIGENVEKNSLSHTKTLWLHEGFFISFFKSSTKTKITIIKEFFSCKKVVWAHLHFHDLKPFTRKITCYIKK